MTEHETDLLLRDLCEAIMPVADAMQAVFASRLASLIRDRPFTMPWPPAADWQGAWLHGVLETWRIARGEPALVRAVAELVALGARHGLLGAHHALAVEALTWACRDVFPARLPADVVAAIESRTVLLVRVAPREALRRSSAAPVVSTSAPGAPGEAFATPAGPPS